MSRARSSIGGGRAANDDAELPSREHTMAKMQETFQGKKCAFQRGCRATYLKKRSDVPPSRTATFLNWAHERGENPLAGALTLLRPKLLASRSKKRAFRKAMSAIVIRNEAIIIAGGVKESLTPQLPGGRRTARGLFSTAVASHAEGELFITPGGHLLT